MELSTYIQELSIRFASSRGGGFSPLPSLSVAIYAYVSSRFLNDAIHVFASPKRPCTNRVNHIYPFLRPCLWQGIVYHASLALSIPLR